MPHVAHTHSVACVASLISIFLLSTSVKFVSCGAVTCATVRATKMRLEQIEANKRRVSCGLSEMFVVRSTASDWLSSAAVASQRLAGSNIVQLRHFSTRQCQSR